MIIPKLPTESQGFFDALNEGNDLTCVLIAVNYLDQRLLSILQNSFKKGKTAKNLLKPEGGLLGTFYARNAIVYCLNHITKETRDNLHQFANIRNRFAHNYPQMTFNDPKIECFCNVLVIPEFFKPVISNESALSNRDKFSIIAALMGPGLKMQEFHLQSKNKQKP